MDQHSEGIASFVSFIRIVSIMMVQLVHGLKIFADYFPEYEDRYVPIGGAACDIWLSKAEFQARAEMLLMKYFAFMGRLL